MNIAFDKEFCDHFYQSRRVVKNNMCENCTITFVPHWLDYYCEWYNDHGFSSSDKQCRIEPISKSGSKKNWAQKWFSKHGRKVDYSIDLERRLNATIEECNGSIDHDSIMFAFINRFRAKLATGKGDHSIFGEINLFQMKLSTLPSTK